MQDKGIITKKPNVREVVVYLLDTIDGKEHLITRANYEELKPLIHKVEMYGAFVANEDTENELIIPMRNIVSIRKDRREEVTS